MGLATVKRQPAFQTVPHDQLALAELLSKYSPVMYRAALRKLRNQADAEDAVQDALMSASKHIGQFKRECNISTWLVAIAINASRMQLRRQLRHRALSLEQPSDDGASIFFCDPADGRPGPEEIYKGAELRRIIGQLMDELSPSLRDAFRLRVLEGFSTQEAARALDISQGTMKARYFRARARIRALFCKSRGRSQGARSRSNANRASSLN